MSEYGVPKGMLERAKRINFSNLLERVSFLNGMRFACKDIAEHPIVPTWKQIGEIVDDLDTSSPRPSVAELQRGIAVEWQRRMFREPEPETTSRYLWTCVTCHNSVMSRQNDRPTCAHCNAEMKPYRPGNEHIKDLLRQEEAFDGTELNVKASECNKLVIEAERRGYERRKKEEAQP